MMMMMMMMKSSSSSSSWPWLISFVVLSAAVQTLWALDNGLALTPPMGWISWQRYRCTLDCEAYPDDCISETLYKRMADSLVNEGYRDVGYNQINIDDCWAMLTRDDRKRLVADKTRFPSGIKALAKYMHERGLKLGIYADAGLKTCAGYPGTEDFVDIDAQTFADWDVDMLKFDGCFVADESDAGQTYRAMSKALNKTGKQIVYSCEWPLYQREANLTIDYDVVAATCNLFRNFDDIRDELYSIKNTVDFYVQNQDKFVAHQKPGAFFDPDMLVIGNYGLSFDESQLQMALWAIWGSPLFMSNDLTHVKPEFKAILQNRAVIDLNQDPEGKMGKKINEVNGVQIFSRPVLPKIQESYSFGLAFVLFSDGGPPQHLRLKASDCGLRDTQGYELVDLFTNETIGRIVKPEDSFKIAVNPSGARLLKATLIRP